MTTVPPSGQEIGLPDLRLGRRVSTTRDLANGALRVAIGQSRHRRTQPLLLLDVLTALALSMAVLPLGTAAPGAGDLLVVTTWVTLLAACGAYSHRPVPFGPDAVRNVASAGLALATAGLAAIALTAREPAAGSVLLLAAAATATAVAGRWIVDQPLLAGRTTGRIRVLVAGHPRDVDHVLAELGSSGRRVYEPVAVCLVGSAAATPTTPYDLPVMRGTDNLVTASTRHDVDAVVVAPCRHLDPVRLRRLGWELEAVGTQLLVTSGLLDVGRSRTSIGSAGSLSLLHIRHAELHGSRRVLKNLIERLVACVALLVLAPLLLGIAVLVRSRSAGPAFYRQIRVGKDGVPFSIVKFRTMSIDSDERRSALVSSVPEQTVLFKLRADPRITPEGGFLRRYSLDELPQLINVARGEMSLVGPRPPLPSEVAKYEPDAHRRLAVTPGMTGLWQVSGRSELTWEESLRLDLRYVDNWSPSLDLRIVCRTARAVLGHRGAY